MTNGYAIITTKHDGTKSFRFIRDDNPGFAETLCARFLSQSQVARSIVVKTTEAAYLKLKGASPASHVHGFREGSAWHAWSNAGYKAAHSGADMDSAALAFAGEDEALSSSAIYIARRKAFIAGFKTEHTS